MFLKNKNIIFKIRRSKVTDYAALKSIMVNIALCLQELTTFVYQNMSLVSFVRICEFCNNGGICVRRASFINFIPLALARNNHVKNLTVILDQCS